MRAAEAVGLKGMRSKSIAAVAGEAKKRIEGRMGAALRTAAIEVVVAEAEH